MTPLNQPGHCQGVVIPYLWADKGPFLLLKPRPMVLVYLVSLVFESDLFSGGAVGFLHPEYDVHVLLADALPDPNLWK